MHARPVVGDQETLHKNVIPMFMTSTFSKNSCFCCLHGDYSGIVFKSLCFQAPKTKLLKTPEVNKQNN